MGPDILRENFALLIPLTAMLIPIVAIVAYYLNKASKDRLRHETIRELVRAGQPIPPELLSGDDTPVDKPSPGNPNRSLTPGVTNLAVGLGLMGMFWLMKPGSWLWGIGLIPFCLGLGFLLLWRIEQSAAKPPAA
ncbi:DUF6249 domain-containing protein [Inhella crocodyli]|jgi:hypothetical protein|uniref:DUF6249 domain-containing protein n=1 Tax=Inhella crocodyli TaxID=2499851 RepID=A0A3S2UD32_9BURK|nr:DUF6249 domain-containing protein [Inhella crocodyli]RVT84828.1 hypothetical protein EOD73_11915 [Inhella crocodyli]